MKNITVSVDDEIYRAARVKAAAADTSVSAVVKQFLTAFARGETEANALQRREVELRASVGAFAGGDRIAREAVHVRSRR